jgi:WD40 repeat protein
MPPPLVFLSHSGADTEAARELKRRLLASPDAQKASLKVWFDKDDLRPGGQWQPQIEQAIEKDATAFVVYVGSRGVINWVDVEVRVALSRAATDKDFLFIPVLATDIGANVLPPFARLYQGVSDPLGKGDKLESLLKAVLKADWDKVAKLIDEPFVGLRAMREEESDRFFGRKAEIDELAEKFRKLRLVAIVADSGTGKSSLARAGFAPAFRGGALIDPAREEARDKIWQVVTMRPRADPAEGLRQGVEVGAQKLGRSLADVGTLRDSVSIADAGKTAFALRCGLLPDKTSTLLIVDQFEELFTATPKQDAAAFAALLLALADGPSEIRILLTVRSDYFNLASGVKDASSRPALFERLTANNNDAVLRLKAMSPAGLREAVLEPLKLAGETNETALADAVQTDISHQASDLPLLQVALRAAWQRHHPNGPPLLECYQSVGRVSGALANEADSVLKRLPPDDQARLESIFVRLVRLGDTGGATRRAAALDEFDEPRRDLLQRLGSAEYGSLVAVGQTTAEIAHEALITQWPWLAERLNSGANDIRRLDRLTMKASGWAAAPPVEKTEYLAYGAERQLFSELAAHRPDWLSATEKNFVAASQKAHQDELDTARTIARRNFIAAAVAVVFAVAAVIFAYYAQHERSVADEAAQTAEHQKAIADANAAEAIKQKNGADKANELAEEEKAIAVVEKNKAVKNESVALAALAVSEAEKHPVNAAKFALAAWPRSDDDVSTPRLPIVLDAMGQVLPNLRERKVIRNGGRFAAFSPDGKWIATYSRKFMAEIIDASTGAVVAALRHPRDHELETRKGVVDGTVAYSPDGKLVAAAFMGVGGVWDAGTNQFLADLDGKLFSRRPLMFSWDGHRIVAPCEDKTARIWNAESGQTIATLKGHKDFVWFAAFSPDGTQVVTASADGTAQVWDAASGASLLTLIGHTGIVRYAAFSRDGKRIVTGSDDKTARLWDAASGRQIAELDGHEDKVDSAVLSPDGTRIVTSSWDFTARLWDGDSGQPIHTLKGHNGFVTTAAFSRDGSQVVTTSADGSARIWDVVSGRTVAVLAGQGEVASAIFSPDDQRVLTTSFSDIRLWDVGSGRTLAVMSENHDTGLLPDGSGWIWSAAFSTDGKRVLTASRDGSAHIWDVSSNRKIATFDAHGGRMYAAGFNHDASLVVTGSSNGVALIWDVASGRQIRALMGHTGTIHAAAFSPDGARIITASEDRTARIWDVPSGKTVFSLVGHTDQVTSAAFSPDNKRVVTASFDKTARLWDAESGRLLRTFTGHGNWLWSAAFSNDGAKIVTGAQDHTARVWDPDTGRSVAILRGQALVVDHAAFSPDGTRIVTASSDDTAWLWDASSGRAVASLKGHAGGLRHAVFSPDGTRVVTGSDDGTARIWDVSTIPKGNILQVACALLEMREQPVSLDDVTDYPLTFDHSICVTDPPPPDSVGAAEVKTAQ